MKNNIISLLSIAVLSIAASSALADSSNHHHNNNAGDHAPIGVMGDHMHDKGEWMVSYRYMNMDMGGNRIGTNGVDPETIVTTIANPFAGPANLRVVPTEMRMEMHMIGAMYAPSDVVTLMAMTNWTRKEMDHITFQGMMGTTRLGTFTTESEGFGDTSVSSLVRIYQDETHHVHFNAGLSLPTGSIDEEDTVLTPMNTRTRLRLPYAMQLGSGTFDALPGLTYTGRTHDWNWGAQYKGVIRLENENHEGYSLGDQHSVTAWGGYNWADWVNTSLRLTGTTLDGISGSDSTITAPVQTANPDNYGGEVIELGIGANFYVPSGTLEGNRFAIEANLPLYRDLNGPQMENDLTITAGWQKSF